MNDSLLTLRPIAYAVNGFREKFGVPRQSGRVPELETVLVFEKEFSVKEAFRGLEGYSHLWLLWGFSQNGRGDGAWSPTVRPPRLGGNVRMGVFATRSPNRPNPIGLSLVKAGALVFENGRARLTVYGADMTSDTPVYDIKPYLPQADHAENAAGGFASAFVDHSVRVLFTAEAAGKIPPEIRKTLEKILAEDPRPSYQQDDRTYGMSYAGYQIYFRATAENTLLVTDAAPESKNMQRST